MTTQSSLRLTQPPKKTHVLNAVLTMAGSDSSGGAGIEADIKTITAHKAYALTCITALTAQNTMGVDAVWETPKHHLRQMLQSDLAEFVHGYAEAPPLKIVKTGMLTESAVEVLAETLAFLRLKHVRLVMDPVMVATSGKSLVSNTTVHLMLRQIVPSAYLCTPNFDEAVFLWKAANGDPQETDGLETVVDFSAFVVKLQRKLQCSNLLVKGGHVPFVKGTRKAVAQVTPDSAEIHDFLYEATSDTLTVFLSRYMDTQATHGTGCTLASAISSNLANGKGLCEAVALSISYVHRAMAYSLSQMGQMDHDNDNGNGNGNGNKNGPLNHTVAPPASFMGVLDGSKWSVGKLHGLFFDYFKTHPSINESWLRYTRHPFLKLVATNSLPFDDFLYFLKQDLYYLIHYAKVHGQAISVAPDCEQIEAQTKIITNIMAEIDRHKQKLAHNYNIDYSNVDLDAELLPGPACIAYCEFLDRTGREQDFMAIKVAVAPCLHGYAEAGLYGVELRQQFDGKLNVLETQAQSDVYDAWLADYASDWYREAHENGIKSMDSLLLGASLSDHRKDELRSMFRDVVELEIAFWDEVVDRSRRRAL